MRTELTRKSKQERLTRNEEAALSVLNRFVNKANAIADIVKETESQQVRRLRFSLLEVRMSATETRLEFLKKLKTGSPKDIDIHGIYFPLGRFDGVIPFDAPDLITAMKFAVDIGMMTGARVETLPLVPIEQL